MDKDLANRLSAEIGIDVEQIIREWWEVIILRDLFASSFGGSLVFKGGTALRLAYGSPRFSEDLDFSKIKDFSYESFKSAIEDIEAKYSELDIRDCSNKFYTYFALYRIREPWKPFALSIKIEISKRTLDKKRKIYELMNLKSEVSNIEVLGNVMTIENVYKEKLGALKTRDAPRDLFDVWYLCNTLRKIYRAPTDKFETKVLTRDLRKYLPKKYWKVIETLGGR